MLFRSKEEKEQLRKEGKCTICGGTKDTGKDWCRTCAEAEKKRLKDWRFRTKVEVLRHYCPTPKLKCVCCGETEIVFLTVDHINGGGSEERRRTNQHTGSFLRYLKKQGYPEGYQVLCWNCNCGRVQNGGICPHKTVSKREPAYTGIEIA